MTEFDEWADPEAYEREVERSIAFAGVGPEMFISAKADLVVRLAETHLGDPGRLSVLDVGCGVGETDRFLEGRFRSLTGVDVSPESVNAAARRNPWASYRSYPAGRPLPFADGEFDLAFAICVIHHVPESERLALTAEMSRVVRPGGIVAVFEHNPYNPLTRRAVSNCEFDADAVLLARRGAERLLSEAGLRQLESAYILFFPRPGERLRSIERGLRWLPLGAQYYVASESG
jgi:SAM-dependent methyltransferase